MKKIRSALLSTTLSLGAAVALAGPCPAFAQAPQDMQTYNFDLEPQPLADALKRVARKTGRPVLFAASDLKGLRASALKGELTADDALKTLLAGSGLETRRSPNGTYAVLPAAEAAQVQDHDVQDIVVTAQRGEGETSVNVRDSRTTGRTGLSLRDTPQSTSVVTAKSMELRQSTSVADAVSNVSGVRTTRGDTATGGGLNFSIRGQGVTPLINGVSTNRGGLMPVAGIERVEILRGPSAVLSGRENRGGVVNVVTKRPSADFFAQVSMEYATFDDMRVTGDISGALTSNKYLSARLIGTYQIADRNYYNYDGGQENLIQPAIRFKNANTDITFTFAAAHAFNPPLPYTFVNTDASTVVVRPLTPLGNARDGSETTTRRYNLDAEQKFGSWLTLAFRGQHQTDDTRYTAYTLATTTALRPNFTTGAGTFGYNYGRSDNSSDSVDGFGRVNFDLGGVSTTLVLGMNYSRIYQRGFTGNSINIPGNIYTGNLPVQSLPDRPLVSLNEQSQWGQYAQATLKFWKLTLVGEVRRNLYRSTLTDVQFAASTPDRHEAVTPSFGAVLDIDGNTSLYGNYAEGYTAVFPICGPTFNEACPTLTTQNIEFGVKRDFFNRRLSVTADVFQLEESARVVLTDALYYQGIPGVRARGFELDVRGQILPGWEVSGSYTYGDYKPLSFDPPVVLAQPKAQYSLFSAFTMPRGRFKGWGGAIGLSGNSTTITQLPRGIASGQTLFTVPSSFRVDANIYARLGRARLNIGIRNLFDKQNYLPSVTSYYLPLDQRRQVRATLTFDLN